MFNFLSLDAPGHRPVSLDFGLSLLSVFQHSVLVHVFSFSIHDLIHDVSVHEKHTHTSHILLSISNSEAAFVAINSIPVHAMSTQIQLLSGNHTVRLDIVDDVISLKALQLSRA